MQSCAMVPVALGSWGGGGGVLRLGGLNDAMYYQTKNQLAQTKGMMLPTFLW
jgi:hypothetical protein